MTHERYIELMVGRGANTLTPSQVKELQSFERSLRRTVIGYLITNNEEVAIKDLEAQMNHMNRSQLVELTLKHQDSKLSKKAELYLEDWKV